MDALAIMAVSPAAIAGHQSQVGQSARRHGPRRIRRWTWSWRFQGDLLVLINDEIEETVVIYS